jgi:hypothetical protein
MQVWMELYDYPMESERKLVEEVSGDFFFLSLQIYPLVAFSAVFELTRLAKQLL